MHSLLTRTHAHTYLVQVPHVPTLENLAQPFLLKSHDVELDEIDCHRLVLMHLIDLFDVITVRLPVRRQVEQVIVTTKESGDGALELGGRIVVGQAAGALHERWKKAQINLLNKYNTGALPGSETTYRVPTGPAAVSYVRACVHVSCVRVSDGGFETTYLINENYATQLSKQKKR